MKMGRKNKIKILSIIMCVCLVICAVLNQFGILRITRAADLWNGEFPEANASYAYSKLNNKVGAGTSANPYKIGTGADLAQLSVNINAGVYNSGSQLYFDLISDINLNSYEWAAIGNGMHAFSGVFNGNGYTITGMKITLDGTKSSDQGLFGYIEKSTISNLKVAGNIIQSAATGTEVGGIVGYAADSTITDCGFNGYVNGNIKVGGIVGACSGKGSNTILNACYSNAAITATSRCAGGIVGAATSNITIINCYNKGSVSLTSTVNEIQASASGIAGYVENADIVNCYNAGSVTGSYIAGGIATCGEGKYAALKNCYNVGTITGSKAGALSGYFPSTTEMDNCFYLTGSCTEEVPAGYVGTAKNIGTFASATATLQKNSCVDETKWTLTDKTLKNALDSYVTQAVASYSIVREWSEDDNYVNQGFPILTKTVGHVHDRAGGTTIKKEATCTENGIVVYKCSKCDYTETDVINALGHDYQTEVSDAGCTVSGTSTQVCSRCSHVGGVTEIAPTGHHMVSYTKDATCTENGYTVQKCDNPNCTYEDASTKVVSLAKGHKETSTVSDASCTLPETITYTCSVCGNVRRVEGSQKALGHAWDNEEGIYHAATCLEVGGNIRTCQRCALEQFVGEEEPLAAHKWVTSSAVEPTCTQSGYTVFRCSCCSTTMNDNYVLPTGHTFKTSIVEPTCTTNGYTRHSCLNCDYYYDDAITSTTAHQYVLDSITPATCLEDGIRVYKCETCGAERKETIPAIGSHNYVLDEENSKKQSCSEGGYDLYVCTACGATKKENVTSEGFGHTYEESIVKPTCIDSGYTIHTCSTCGDIYRSDETKPLGHSYVDEVVEPTTTTRGYTEHKCSRCDDSYIDTYIAATPDASYNAAEGVLTLSDMEETMMYSIDGGKNWTAAESTGVSLEAADIDLEQGIWVRRPGNEVIPVSDSSVQVIKVDKPVVPDSIDLVEPDSESATGTINGVDETMEYRPEDAKEWTPVSGSSIINLEPGIYYIRIKAIGSNIASDEKKIVINEYVAPTPTPTPKATATPAPTVAPTDSTGKQTTAPNKTTAPDKTQAPGKTTEPGKTSTPSSTPGSNSTGNVSGNDNNATGGNNTTGGTNTNNSNSGNNNASNGSTTDVNGATNSSTDTAGSSNSGSTSPAATSKTGVVSTDVYYTSNGGTTSKSANSTKTAKTGDANMTALWIALAGISLGTLVVFKKKKEVNE